MWFLQIVRSFFYTLDSTLFNFIPTVYDLLITISRTTILTQGQIKAFADRIQLLLGVFMLFKVSFSLITYIINPDDFSDKGKGFGKLWMNIVITLLMLVLVPYAFSMAYELQALILEDNAIGTLILGTEPKNNYINTAGQEMAYTVMIPFYMPDVSNDNLTSCINMVNEAGEFDQNCSNGLYQATGLKEPDTMIENYKMGVENSSLGLTFRLDIAKQTITSGSNSGGFLINYMAPISTVVAVVVLLLLITFCMDVALRSVKLAFLQLISPIPIISFVDPKSGKDGLFKKWYKMCFSTYISLFVRLAALYFGVYIISQVNGMYDVVNGSQVSDPWVKIFVIIGVLMFVKQLPKILEGLGIKLDGAKFQLNPFKKFEDEAFGGKQIIGAGAAGLAGVAAGGSNLINAGNRIASNWRNASGKGFWAHAGAVAGGLGGGLLSTAGGIIGGTRRGLVGAARGEKFGQIYSHSYSGAMDARMRREDMKDAGVGALEALGASVQKTMGMHTSGDTVKATTENIKKLQSTYDAMMNAAKGNDEGEFKVTINGEEKKFKGLKNLEKFREQMAKSTVNRSDFKNADGDIDEAKYQKALIEQQNALNDIEKAMKDRLDAIATSATTITDAATQAAIQQGYKQMQDIAKNINASTRKIDPNITEIPSSGASAMNGTSKGVNSQITTNDAAIHAQDVDQYAKPFGPGPGGGGRPGGGPGGRR